MKTHEQKMNRGNCGTFGVANILLNSDKEYLRCVLSI